MLDLSVTATLMTSPDHRHRFIAEYLQTKTRYEELKRCCLKIEASMISGEVEKIDHDCPTEILERQMYIMRDYLHVLELRAIIEDIDLTVAEYYYTYRDSEGRAKEDVDE